MKITSFRDIEKFPHSSYIVNVAWSLLESRIKAEEQEMGLDLEPDFQRAHVWNQKQQIEYCEYVLKGGTSGKDLYFNCLGYQGPGELGQYTIVDGKQRLQAVRLFMAGEIKVFGSYISEYTDRLRMGTADFIWNIAELKNKNEVLKWYLAFNSGGTPHTEQELKKVKDMII